MDPTGCSRADRADPHARLDLFTSLWEKREAAPLLRDICQAAISMDWADSVTVYARGVVVDRIAFAGSESLGCRDYID